MTVSTVSPGIWQGRADGSWLLLPNGPVFSAGVPAPGAPTAPDVQVTGTTTTSITVEWGPVANATSYALTLNGVAQGSQTSLSRTFSGLASGTSYTIGVAAVNDVGSSQVDVITATTPTSEPPPALGGTSYWTALAPVTHGVQLDPSGPKKTGIPPGTALTAASSNTISTPGTITGKSFVGQVEVNASGVTFQRCRFQASGWISKQSCGTNSYVIHVTDGSLTDIVFIDCEFYGGASITCYGGTWYERCYFADGNDIMRVRALAQTLMLRENVFANCKRLDSDSHSDAIQYTNTGSGSLWATVERNWVSAWLGTDPHNAAIQVGGFGTGGGPDGTVYDNFLDGGHVTVNAQKQPASGHYIEFRRNQFGRHYGLHTVADGGGGPFASNGGPTISFDQSNVWADTLEPIFP